VVSRWAPLLRLLRRRTRGLISVVPPLPLLVVACRLIERGVECQHVMGASKRSSPPTNGTAMTLHRGIRGPSGDEWCELMV
jgi:hypothetical protein